jgi:hypothetical protein
MSENIIIEPTNKKSKKIEKNESEKEEIKIDNQTNSESNKKITKKSKINKKEQEMILEQELKRDCVSKGEGTKTAKQPVVKKVKTTVKRYNDEGQLITKKGTVDKRQEMGRERFKKYQELIAQRKMEKQPPIAIKTPYVESDDSDDDNIEFTIETIDALESQPIAPVAPTKVNPYLEEERERLKKATDDMVKLQLENEKLKDSMYFNSHLNMIDKMARSVKLKF